MSLIRILAITGLTTYLAAFGNAIALHAADKLKLGKESSENLFRWNQA